MAKKDSDNPEQPDLVRSAKVEQKAPEKLMSRRPNFHSFCGQHTGRKGKDEDIRASDCRGAQGGEINPQGWRNSFDAEMDARFCLLT